MEHETQNCGTCVLWRRILEEGASGTPKRPARPGWGQCSSRNLTQMRVKGILETQERHWCTCYVARAQAATPGTSQAQTPLA